MLKFFLVLTCALLCTAFDLEYFCKHNCGKVIHTACLLAPCGESGKCGSGAMYPLDDKSREIILEIHNELRNNIAKGLAAEVQNAPASDMHVLSYDKELEFVAQCWANTCNSKHDSCRATSKFKMVGQNMFALETTGEFDIKDDRHLERAAKAWYAEIKYATVDHIDAFKNTNPQQTIGHFTQVVWSKTTHIGCGRTLAISGNRKKMYFYCNYGPAGNMLKAPVYKRGAACEGCSGSCNTKYTGLCGTIRPLDEDRFEKPFEIGRSSKCTTSIWIVITMCNLIYI